MDTTYDDVNKWSQQQNDLLDRQQELNQQIVDKSVQKNIDELNYQKNKIDKETNKTTSGLYTDYQKMANNYGLQAEQRANMGLANSGYSETARVNLYNNYQKNVTETVNNANQLKADFDFQISQARQQGDIQMAQNQLALYQQKMQLLTQEYDMRNEANKFAYQKERDLVSDKQWQDQFDYQKQRANVQDKQWQDTFDYQKQRDTVSDNQWRESFDYQKNRDNISDSQWRESFDYQKSRDAIADEQWEKNYQLSKKASTSSGRRYSSSGSGSNDDGYIIDDETYANTLYLMENGVPRGYEGTPMMGTDIGLSDYYEPQESGGNWLSDTWNNIKNFLWRE